MAQQESRDLCRENLIIMVVKDNIEQNELPKDLRDYLRKNSVIDATKDTDNILQRIR